MIERKLGTLAYPESYIDRDGKPKLAEKDTFLINWKNPASDNVYTVTDLYDSDTSYDFFGSMHRPVTLSGVANIHKVQRCPLTYDTDMLPYTELNSIPLITEIIDAIGGKHKAEDYVSVVIDTSHRLYLIPIGFCFTS